MSEDEFRDWIVKKVERFFKICKWFLIVWLSSMLLFGCLAGFLSEV